ADLLGLEYEYAAGYDPQSLVQFFEKLNVKEKEHHSFIAKAFATHPMTADRIKAAQKDISELLPARDQYIIDTSDFETIKARLANDMHLRRPEEGGRPVLRKRGPEDEGNHSEGNGPILRKRTN